MNVHVYICVSGPLLGSSCPQVRVPLSKTPTPQIFSGDQAIASHDLTYDAWGNKSHMGNLLSQNNDFFI